MVGSFAYTPSVTLSDIPSARFTEATLATMHRFVLSAVVDPHFQLLAAKIVSACPNKDYLCEGEKILKGVKSLVRYVRDPHEVELVQTPWITLNRKAGDCDDMTTLVSALASAIGHPYEFVTIKAEQARPYEWSHVYPRIQIAGKWYGADASVGRSYLGWEPERFFEKALWPEPKR